MSEREAGAAASGRRPTGRDFLRQIVERDLDTGRHGGRVVTRFPPEPNGFLHLGHVKAISVNYDIAIEYGGRYHLRFDDTNPETEDERYVEAMQRDIRWLGYDWGEHLYFAADYFERMYECAEILVKKGKAYVDSQNEEEIRENRGSLTEPGTDSPYRDRSVEENLDLLRRMRAGEFPDGAHVLRARIDMAHPNMIMRDPLLYRIRHAHHYRTGDAWCIYPMYDYAHCLEDAFEDVTHSFCTLEFENNREIYDWILDEVGFEEPRTHQYEFGPLAVDYTVLSKRRILPLVREGIVSGWDDPRLFSVAALRRRGIPAEALLDFVRGVGITKVHSRTDLGRLDHAVRDHLNPIAPRVMAVLDPVPLTVVNRPSGDVEWLDAPYFPKDVGREGSRKIPFARDLLIERSDFSLDPPRGFRRMSPGQEVRLRYGYVVRCVEAITDPESGEVREILCTYDPETRGGDTPDGRKVPGTIHWVAAKHALAAEVRLHDRLFTQPDPDDVPEGGSFLDNVDADSLTVRRNARVEPSVAADPPETRYQFERTGYFWRDPVDSKEDALVFNRIVALRDTWSARTQPTASTGESERARGDVAPSEHRADAAPDATGSPEGNRTSAAAEADDRVSDERRAAREAQPDLAARFERYQNELGLSLDEADVLTGSRAAANLFEAALAAHGDARSLAAWIVNDVRGALNERDAGPDALDGKALGALVAMVDAGSVSRTAAKEVLAELVEQGGDPEEIVDRRGLRALSGDAQLVPLVEAVLAEHTAKVDAYRSGKHGLLGFFVGQVMRSSGGRADAKRVSELLSERLAHDTGDDT